MRFCTLRLDAGDHAAVEVGGAAVPLRSLSELAGMVCAPSLLDLVGSGDLSWISGALRNLPMRNPGIQVESVLFGPLFRDPPKLWGVGLNYVRHADELGVTQPDGIPGSYLRPSSTIIGDGDVIRIPRESRRVTAEAELGVVIGKTCRDVSVAEAADVVFGFTSVLDMTAEDVIRVNPRYIPWAKAFDTFCSVGPWLVTADEVRSLKETRISTVLNGKTIATNTVSAMKYDPYWLVSFFSSGMTLEAGSIIATGTPGAAVISGGDMVESVVEGISHLRNRVAVTDDKS